MYKPMARTNHTLPMECSNASEICCITLEPPIVDTLKRGQPLNKGQLLISTSHSGSTFVTSEKRTTSLHGTKDTSHKLSLVERLHCTTRSLKRFHCVQLVPCREVSLIMIQNDLIPDFLCLLNQSHSYQ